MLRPFLRKRAKISRGIWNTYVVKKGRIHDDRSRWDELHYTQGVSDSRTLSAGKSPISARYHYASVELQILRHLGHVGMEVEGREILDIGAGAGHWIEFYRSLGSVRTVALDVSRASVAYLRNRYEQCPDVTILHGKASELLGGLEGRFDIVNAIGVMFHIVDDVEWSTTIEHMAGVLKPQGQLVIGGHFGLIDGLNVQFDANGGVNKRLRSKRRWRKALKQAGFRDIRIYRNGAYLRIHDVLPENNLLIASR